MNQDRYSLRGVSSTKDEVHAVVDNMSKGLFPGAFCKINPDFLTNNPDKCCVIHSDGSGTKSTLAYLHYKDCRLYTSPSPRDLLGSRMPSSA